ncbi:MAG: hypothetical protein HY744_08145 [Deltaproteobacteria bacterium]|nr:hypothetical protein [Deltaproteobacteria bacterium]
MSQVWGGIYDPEVDRWLPMSSEGAPDCYFGFYAGWDGCRAIIMGQRGVVVGKCPNVEAYVPEFWAYYPPPEVRAAASAEQAAKPQP